MAAWGLLIAAYLVGSFPTSHLAGRWAGVDLRERGSGNLGGTNVYRVLGGRPAVVVLTIDLLKGFVPVWLFSQWDGRPGGWAVAYGAAALAGHIYPVWTRFRGGKGVATAAGTLLGLAPIAVVIAALVWTGTLLLTRLASVASLLAATLVPLLARGSGAPGHVVLYALLIGAVVWWTHRHNVVRLVRGEEIGIRLRGGGVDGGPGSDER
ncbi:MAG: glycerol-3-phosphate 1-O-acyltransferase PlsY [Gemmatimonadota bacterium]